MYITHHKASGLRAPAKEPGPGGIMTKDAAGYGEFFNAQNEINSLAIHMLEGMLGEEGITPPQFFTLRTLKDQGQMCKMSDLAAMRLLTPAGATGIVDKLIHLELVERKFDESDRRVVLLALTDRGAATLSGMERKMEAMMRRFFDGISAGDRATFLRIIRKFKGFLKEELGAHKGKS